MINLEKQGSEIWFEFYRALPSTSIDFLYAQRGYQDYHQYEVVKDINLKNLEEGFLSMSDVDQEKLSIIMQKRGISFADLATPAKWEITKVFGAGGGTQIQLGNSLKYYEDLCLLKEVIKWIRNKLKNSNKK